MMQILEPKLFRYAHKLEIQRTDGILTPPSPLPHLYSVSYYQLSEELARTYPELTLPIFSGLLHCWMNTHQCNMISIPLTEISHFPLTVKPVILGLFLFLWEKIFAHKTW